MALLLVVERRWGHFQVQSFIRENRFAKCGANHGLTFFLFGFVAFRLGCPSMFLVGLQSLSDRDRASYVFAYRYVFSFHFYISSFPQCDSGSRKSRRLSIRRRRETSVVWLPKSSLKMNVLEKERRTRFLSKTILLLFHPLGQSETGHTGWSVCRPRIALLVFAAVSRGTKRTFHK